MAETKEHVSGGALPDWEVDDLPAPPPYQFGKAFRNILGPGIIALGGSIGSGEWLLGPAITAQYGGRLLWIATIAILLQVILNTEAIRYTLYTGEPMMSGYMRCKPGAPFWMTFYSGINFFRDLARLGDDGCDGDSCCMARLYAAGCGWRNGPCVCLSHLFRLSGDCAVRREDLQLP